MNIVDKLLPGRTIAEDRALATVLRNLATAERRHNRELKTTPTRRGMAGWLSRLRNHEAAIRKATAELTTKLEQLADERLMLLPSDATDVGHGYVPEGLHDDRRYPIVCTSHGTTIQLGGCTDVGAAQRRLSWFTNAIERRRGR